MTLAAPRLHPDVADAPAAKAPAVNPLEREELRIALVMNGGVSLAVWMGGVTNEIFRTVTQQHPVYSRLQAMTRTNARVDIISGTSAGGVNGAALSLALLYGGDFSKLRDVWLQTGALGELLRPPLEANPESLLSGDGFFLKHITEALEALCESSTKLFTTAQMPLDLRLTTTLLAGTAGNTIDDLGASVNDRNYRAYFQFRHAGGVDDFASPREVVPLLARAARSTASFPFAFEPSLVPGDGQPDAEGKGKPDAHLKDGDGKPLNTPRYVIDGGILDNKPFRGALQAIFGMGTRGSVRRVLAYVNPDPGDGIPPSQLGKEPPQLSRVLTESVLGIPQSQSIADQLQAIQDHNDRIRARRNSVVSLVQAFGGRSREITALSAALFKVYRTRRLSSTFELFVYQPLPEAIARAQVAKPPAEFRVVGKHGRDQLKTTFTQIDWQGWIPRDWPLTAEAPAYQRETWEWGLFPVEFGAKLMLDLLRKMQRLEDYATEPPSALPAADPIAAVTASSEVPDAPRQTGTGEWNDQPAAEASAQAASTGSSRSSIARMLQRLRLAPFTDASPPTEGWDCEALKAVYEMTAPSSQDELAVLWDKAYGLIGELSVMRKSELPRWERRTDRLLRVMNGAAVCGIAAPTAKDLDAEFFRQMFKFLSTPQRRLTCSDLAYQIAAILRRAVPLALEIAKHSRASQRLRGPDLEQAEGLDALARFCAVPLPLAEDAANRALLFRLMSLEVIEFAFNDHDALNTDTVIELVQISGNSASPLGGDAKATHKLLGLQMGHFGAFYKTSWRANDWTFGRLDGAERLVRILLNPERLNRFYFKNARAAFDEIKSIALGSVDSPVLKRQLQAEWDGEGCEGHLLDELAFLEDIDQKLPDTLPICARVLTRRLHYGILREEIPGLLDAIASDLIGGGNTEGAGPTLLRNFGRNVDGEPLDTRPFSPEMAKRAMKGNLIASETILDEAGSDLFTRTLAHTTATLQALLSSKTAKLGPVSLFFAGMKLPIMGFYFVARGLTHQSRTSAALNGSILMAGLVLVAFQFLGDPLDTGKAGAHPHAFVTLGWVLLAYGLLFSVVRAPRTIGSALLIGVVVAAFAYDWPGKWVVLALVTVLVLSTRLPMLQWVFGFAGIAGAAMWAAGGLPRFEPTGIDIFWLAKLICLTLLFAIWQASEWSARAERAARGWIRSGGKALGKVWNALRQKNADPH